MIGEASHQSGIYCIRNTATTKLYVGSAIDLKSRKNVHRYHLERGTHHSKKLQNSWNKHGALAFEFDVLELVSDSAALIEREQHWIDSFDACRRGYNVAPKAGSNLGVKFSAEACAKIGAAHKGLFHSAESKAKMSASTRSVKKPPRTEAHKANLSTAIRGKVRSAETRNKLSVSKTGIKHSPETRAKMSASQKSLNKDVRDALNEGNRLRGITEDGRRRLSEAARGRRLSDSAKAKISAARMGKPLSPEHIAKRQETRLANEKFRFFEKEEAKIANAPPLSSKMTTNSVANIPSGLPANSGTVS